MSSRHATVIAAVRCCERAGSGRHRKRSSILPLVVLLLLSVIIDRTAGSLETVGDFVEAPKPASLQGKSREQIKKEFDAFLKDIWMKKYFHQWKPFGTFSVETLDSSSPKVSALGYEKLKRTKEVDMSKCKTNQMKIPLIKEERSGDELERVCQGHAFVNKCEGVCFSSLRPSVSTFAGMHKVFFGKVTPSRCVYAFSFYFYFFNKIV